MKVVAYDPFLDAAAARLHVELLPLEELLAPPTWSPSTCRSPSRRATCSPPRLQAMKPGALLVNCARGGVVDEAALLEPLECGHLAGAALDVFAEEPPKDLALVRHPKVVATPHLGAQTREAQERISTETAEMVLAALAGSLAVAAVNLPFRPAGAHGEPYLALGEQLGRLAGLLLAGPPHELQVEPGGSTRRARAGHRGGAQGRAATFLGEAVNYVNAERIAESRGIEVVRSTTARPATTRTWWRSRSPGRPGRASSSTARCSASATRASCASAASGWSSGPRAASWCWRTATCPASSAGSARCSARRNQHRRHPPRAPRRRRGGAGRAAPRPGAEGRGPGEARGAARGAAGATGRSRARPGRAKGASMAHVGVIFGGRSVEHQVSIRSARTVARGLPDAGHQVTPLGIAQDGCWISPPTAAEVLAATPAPSRRSACRSRRRCATCSPRASRCCSPSSTAPGARTAPSRASARCSTCPTSAPA